MKPSYSLLPSLLAAVFLTGCPDSKMPKVPPSAPEPKAANLIPLKAPSNLLAINAQQTQFSA